MKYGLILIFGLISSIPIQKITLNIDKEASELKWTAYHLAKSFQHTGNMKLTSGKIEMEGDNIVGGEFIIDMNTISNTSLADKKENKNLVEHLKSDDFFDVERFPEAKLVITNASFDGVNNYMVEGDITIRGITKAIKFDVKRNDKKTFTSTIKIDRVAHEVMHGWNLENAVIQNIFDLDVKLVVL